MLVSQAIKRSWFVGFCYIRVIDRVKNCENRKWVQLFNIRNLLHMPVIRPVVWGKLNARESRDIRGPLSSI